MRAMCCRQAAPPCGRVPYLAFLASFLVLLLPSCNGSGTEEATLVGAPLSDHPHIPLLDRDGNHLEDGSTQPYSPRETCGACHDYHMIADGYHFQQGRTDESGAVVTKDDFFEDGRDHLKSAGMYGKW